jgi:hypothetical protein
MTTACPKLSHLLRDTNLVTGENSVASDQKQFLSHDAWLAQVIEIALEPELPIIDPHHHLWDRPNSHYLLDELLRDTGNGPPGSRNRIRRMPLDVSCGGPEISESSR